jgi:predicted Zn-dependent protease
MVVGDILFPRQSICLSGAGVGWIVIITLLAAAPETMLYREAIRHMRKGEYTSAIEITDRLIAAHPEKPRHRRFRANLYMLAGDFDQSQAEYQALVRENPKDEMGYVGLAEIEMHYERFQSAYDYMQQAHEVAPGNLSLFYYLGMLADRIHQPNAACEHLEKAMTWCKHSQRDSLLARLWLARNYLRLGQQNDAQEQVDQMRKHAAAVQEWKLIFASEQAGPVRHLYEADVNLAEHLLNGTAALDQLEGERHHA